MRDLWEVVGRFIASDGAPEKVEELAKYTTVDRKKTVQVQREGIDPSQDLLHELYPKSVFSLFTAGEVVRFMGIQKASGKKLFTSGEFKAGDRKIQKQYSAAFFEVLGLSIIDTPFREGVKKGEFKEYGKVLKADEKKRIRKFVYGGPEGCEADKLGVLFHEIAWGGGSCRVAFVDYAAYVHTP